MQGRGVKIKPSLPAVKHSPGNSATDKPLAGRVFYLDIPSKFISEKLEKEIKDLGGTVEGFLSKEISCLITSKREAKCAKSLKYSSSIPSPEPVRKAGNGIARPGGRRDVSPKGDSSKKPEKDDVSRGKSLLKKVMKEQEILPKNSILANALNWGVRILHLEEARIYLDQKKRSLPQVKQHESATKAVVKQPVRRKSRAEKLKHPYIKVDDNNSRYRPLFLLSPVFQSFQPLACMKYMPVDNKATTANKVTGTKPGGLSKTWHRKHAANLLNNKVKEEKKDGYCECCLQKFDDLEAHVVEQKHKAYSQGPHYQVVDNIISLFEFDFIDWSKYKPPATSSVVLKPIETIQQEEVKIPEAPHLISSKTSVAVNQGVANVQRTEKNSPHVTNGYLSNNLAQLHEPVDSTSNPVQSLCNNVEPLDSMELPPGSPIIIPETVLSPVPAGETFFDDHKQDDTHHPEGIAQVLILETCLKSAHSLKSSSELEIVSPIKKTKLDDSLLSVTLCGKSVDSNHLTIVTSPIETVHEGVEMVCISKPPIALSGASPPSSPSKPHRKVKTFLHRERKPEPLRTTPEPLRTTPVCKVSVPIEQYDFNSPPETLLALFESSPDAFEFRGFSCNSKTSSHDMDNEVDQPCSQDSFLKGLFSQTSSSASTFYGF